MDPPPKRRKTRWGEAEPATAPSLTDIQARAEAARQALARAGLIPRPRHNEEPATQFDAYGRPVDEDGNILPMVRPKYATLKINMNLEKDEKIRQMYKINKSQLKQFKDPAQNPWYDPGMKGTANKLNRQALRFVEPGFYSRRQETIERRANANGLTSSVALGANETPADRARHIAESFTKTQDDGGKRGANRHTEEKTVLSAAQKDELSQALEAEARSNALRRHLVPLQRKRQDAFPDLEWWDLPLVDKLPAADIASRKLARKWKRGVSEDDAIFVNVNGSEEVFPYTILDAKISHLVEHPVPIEPIAEKESVAPLLFLTEKEKKKMRRKRRREREQEKQDKIRMGLIPPDPPKVKLSNLMRVMGSEAVAGPTGVEMTVRTQVKLRLEAHEARNAAKKLSDEKRAEKTKAKWIQKDETNLMIHCAVFALKDVTETRHLYKIHQNAKQLHMTGAAIMCPGVGNLVVVEGGPRAVKKYKALMLRRIKWSENILETTDQDEEASSDGFCKLLWEGLTKTRSFKQWKMYSCSSEAEVLQYLQDSGGATYWAMLKRHRDSTADVL